MVAGTKTGCSAPPIWLQGLSVDWRIAMGPGHHLSDFNSCFQLIDRDGYEIIQGN